MAERRMMSKKIIHNDAFLDMPTSTQNLYFHLLLEADDDGFVGSPKRIQRSIGASDDDVRLLLAKKFILLFESGVIVIKHWRIHNYIQNDRYNPTTYTEEKSKLGIKKNNVYTMDTDCIHRIGKDRLGKDRLGKDSIDKSKKFSPPTLEEIQTYIKEKNYNVDAQKFYDYFTEGNWHDSKGNPVKNWKQKIITWHGNSKQENRKQSLDEKNKAFLDGLNQDTVDCEVVE